MANGAWNKMKMLGPTLSKLLTSYKFRCQSNLRRILGRVMFGTLTNTLGWINAWINHDCCYMCFVFWPLIGIFIYFLSNGNGTSVTTYRSVAQLSYMISETNCVQKSVSTYVIKFCFQIHYPWYILLYRAAWTGLSVQQLTTCWMMWRSSPSADDFLRTHPEKPRDSFSTLYKYQVHPM